MPVWLVITCLIVAKRLVNSLIHIKRNFLFAFEKILQIILIDAFASSYAAICFIELTEILLPILVIGKHVIETVHQVVLVIAFTAGQMRYFVILFLFANHKVRARI